MNLFAGYYNQNTQNYVSLSGSGNIVICNHDDASVRIEYTNLNLESFPLTEIQNQLRDMI